MTLSFLEGWRGFVFLYSCPLIGLLDSVNNFCPFIIFKFFFEMKICECCNYVLEYNIKLTSAVSRMSVNL